MALTPGSDNMSYVERVLQPGEQVRHVSSIHWIVYWPGVAVALLAVAAYWFGETRLLPSVWQYTSYALALVAVILVFREWYQWRITEIAVTNQRVIYKKGWIRQHTNEMNMDKVRKRPGRSIDPRSHVRLWHREDPRHRRRLRGATDHRGADQTAK